MADTDELTKDGVPMTEFVRLGADTLHFVRSPANGVDPLLAKGSSIDNDVHADPRSPHTSSSEADAQEDEMTKAEADDIEALLTKQMSGYCGSDSCIVCEPKWTKFGHLAQKARLKAKQRRALPSSAFALPESREYPDHDENHAKAALAMLHNASPSEQSRIKADVRRKFPNIKVSKEELDTFIRMGVLTAKQADAVLESLEKSPGVPNGNQYPKEKGHWDTGNSGLAGNMEGAPLNPEASPSHWPGGKAAYELPVEDKANFIHNGGAEKEEIVLILEDGPATKQGWADLNDSLMPTGGASAVPGSGPWEDYDADTLETVAQCLASAARSVMQIRNREVAEAITGSPSDWFDAMKLECAADQIEQALGLVGSLAYAEAAEGSAAKSLLEKLRPGEALLGFIERARSGASVDLGAGTSEEAIVTTLTKEQLDSQIDERAKVAATTAAKKVGKKLEKTLGKTLTKQGDRTAGLLQQVVDGLAKNANNGGDVTPQTMQAGIRGVHDAEDIGSIPGGNHVDGQYQNENAVKSTDGGKVKKSKKNKGSGLSKEAESKLDAVADMVTKMAHQPRTLIPGEFPFCTGSRPLGLDRVWRAGRRREAHRERSSPRRSERGEAAARGRERSREGDHGGREGSLRPAGHFGQAGAAHDGDVAGFNPDAAPRRLTLHHLH